MRDYSYRKSCKIKEQKRRKEVYNQMGYYPTVPKLITSEFGDEYYTEGSQASYKKYLQKQSNKRLRKYPFEEITDGGNYKRVLDLDWLLY